MILAAYRTAAAAKRSKETTGSSREQTLRTMDGSLLRTRNTAIARIPPASVIPICLILIDSSAKCICVSIETFQIDIISSFFSSAILHRPLIVKTDPVLSSRRMVDLHFSLILKHLIFLNGQVLIIIQVYIHQQKCI